MATVRPQALDGYEETFPTETAGSTYTIANASNYRLWNALYNCTTLLVVGLMAIITTAWGELNVDYTVGVMGL